MGLNKIKTFYRISFDSRKTDEIQCSNYADLIKVLIESGSYMPEFEENYLGIAKAMGHDMTDVEENLQRYAVVERKRDILEAEFIDRNGKSKLMPIRIRKYLLSVGMKIDKVILVEDLMADDLFGL